MGRGEFFSPAPYTTPRSTSEQAMQRFIRKIVHTMKDEKLLESQCGLIILSQIKNEYEAERKRYGHAGVAHMNWAAKMAVGMDTGVPWVMCKQDDAPDPLINTCNDFYCDYFSPDKANNPTLWTVAWTGWFSVFGGPNYQRLYHGGTNFGRTSGGPFITTSYDYDAPIDEYALVRQPKHDYLLRLHKVIKFYEKALVNADPAFIALGKYKVAYVFNSDSGGYAAFLSNFNRNSSMRVRFNNMHYDPSPWSISILPDLKNVVFNTAQVGNKPSKVQIVPINVTFNSWETFGENVSSVEDESTITAKGLLEQLSSTRDTTDYLWYTTRVDISSSESFLHGGKPPILTVKSEGPAVVVNNVTGSAFGSRMRRRCTFRGNINQHAGANQISILRVAMGLIWAAILREQKIGVQEPVFLQGLDEGTRDISRSKWSSKVDLKGESEAQVPSKPVPSAFFDAPEGDDPLALDMSRMSKGHMWINGQNIGRYWTTPANGNCTKCSYAGTLFLGPG
ncbi:hypothetical protein SLEP1_g33796 [Rubroshorea leprosula]|uniref:beta-galactosidase n=1 Tax=Rubroshorea leprosula TaxID=152421 RepID=A0AAV5KI05_9ROSI|nr:hypothetical protein SLEP1_g33796 [Rubroshorea leprosula]